MAPRGAISIPTIRIQILDCCGRWPQGRGIKLIRAEAVRKLIVGPVVRLALRGPASASRIGADGAHGSSGGRPNVAKIPAGSGSAQTMKAVTAAILSPVGDKVSTSITHGWYRPLSATYM